MDTSELEIFDRKIDRQMGIELERQLDILIENQRDRQSYKDKKLNDIDRQIFLKILHFISRFMELTISGKTKLGVICR